MSRIATIAAVAALAAAPAASANINDIGKGAPTPAPAAHQVQDLRSPDAVDGFAAPAASSRQTVDNGNSISTWAILAIIAASVGACALLAVMLRRHFQVGRPASV